MARAGPDGSWICPWCERMLPESDFSLDAYRRRHNKGPGRCRDCDREYARAKTALSPSGKYGDADHSLAVHLAKETCGNHAWGAGYYSKSAIAAASARDATARIRGRRELTAGERRDTEAVRMETAERKQVEELRELDKRAAERENVADVIPEIIPADDERKAAVRAARAARRNPDWEPEKFGSGG